jgi:phage terminase large subunit GpA-like protein
LGYLTSAEAVVASAMAGTLIPPPPPDITRWCEENIEFNDRSPIPGKFNIKRFAFLREIHETLSPEHPCREVTVKGSAQWGKTVSVIQPTLATWHEYTPLDSLVVHPTITAATEWVDNKWMPMRRTTPGLREVFGSGAGGKQRDAKFNQETLDQNGSLKVASAGSPADLTGTSRRLVILDDLAKFKMTDKGDPEALAESRASGFEDAKMARVSTPLLKGTCRISRAFDRSDQRYYNLPCPCCGKPFVLTWENFLENIDPTNLYAAHFTCPSCSEEIRHHHKEQMVEKGFWQATNPGGDHPGFFLWRAYAPQRDWASIAVDYAKAMGWGKVETTNETKTRKDRSDQVEAETEQTFYNDVLGLEYEMATDAPDWEALKKRAEAHDPETGQLPLDLNVLPAREFLFTAGVDCQDDRIEVALKAFGRNRWRHTVNYLVIPHHIGSAEGREALDALLSQGFRTERGLRVQIDMLAIDGGAFTDDVWSWAKTHPWRRVIVVKGASGETGPIIAPMKFERRKDGKARRRQKRGFILNVSQMKGQYYTWLKKDHPSQRGYCSFAVGLDDFYFEGITSEHCVLTRQRSGTVTSKWELVDPTVRNEPLDCENYAEAAARRKGWDSLTDNQWDALEIKRGAPGDPDDDPEAVADENEPVGQDNEPVQKPLSKPAKPKKKKINRFNEVLNGR